MSAPPKDSLAWRRTGLDTSAAGVARNNGPGKDGTVELVHWHRQVIADCDRGMQLQRTPLHIPVRK